MEREEKRYRVRVIISGSETQNFYATGPTKLAYMRSSALKALTGRKPDPSHMPVRIDVEEQVRVLSGKKAQWKVIEKVSYHDIPENEREWVKLEKKLREARKDVAEAEAALEKPPLGLMPRKLWEEQRLTAIAQAMERYNLAHTPIPDEWHEELNELTQRAELCPSCKQARVVCVTVWNFGNRSLHREKTAAAPVVKFRTAKFTFDHQTLDAILDAQPMDTSRPRVLDNLDMIDALILRARERGINLEFTNGERTIDLVAATTCRFELGQDIR